MAQKRMLDKKISVSEQVDNLTHESKLIFTWSIPHADDLGLLPFSHKTLKALVIPMWTMPLETFGNHVETIVKEGLFTIFEYNGEKYYRLIKFFNHQTLKKDRKPNTYLNNIESWQEAEEIGFQMEDNGDPSKVKISKEKRTKDTYSSEFELFWNEYPRKVGKTNAYKSWDKQNLDSLSEKIIKKVKEYKNNQQWQKENGQFIPHPTTWLNQGRWEDEVQIDIKDNENDGYRQA